jgi:ribonuclease HIII
VSKSSYTIAIAEPQIKRLREVLEERGFEFGDRPYARFSARKPKLNVTVYEKGPKVLVQGAKTEDFVRFVLEPEVLGEARLGYEEVLQPKMFKEHIGVDESGKGDFFGPLVVVGVWVDKEIARALLDAGATDSKKVGTATSIRRLAKKIRAVPGIAWEIVAIGPERYNEMYASFGNLNRLLAWAHARVIEKLAAAKPACPMALSDQFARPEVLRRALRAKNLGIRLEQRTRAESDVAVAAASILARERFVDWLDKTSQGAGVTLPPGASDAVIKAGRNFIERHGRDALKKIAKLHFRTAGQVLGG